MIVANYKLESANQGLVMALFPGWRILRDPLPPFVGESDVVIISDRVRDVYPSKPTIFISRNSENKLDSKEGIMTLLKDRGVKVSAKQQERFMSLEDEEFWRRAKIVLTLGSMDGIVEEDALSSTFDLFRILFEGFWNAFKTYEECKLPHRVVYSSLLTMMLKTQAEDHMGQSLAYVRALDKNKSHYGTFKKKTLDYLETPMAEKDFLTLLLAINNNR